MKAAPHKTVLLRCKKDGVPLVLVSTAKGRTLVVCPICGSGADSKHVIEQSTGLIGGLLSEEQLIDLRKQIRVADKRVP
jgi:ssDNA-binding Zn-finger/Zn-ribbon topoisomerase 1